MNRGPSIAPNEQVEALFRRRLWPGLLPGCGRPVASRVAQIVDDGRRSTECNDTHRAGDRDDTRLRMFHVTSPSKC